MNRSGKCFYLFVVLWYVMLVNEIFYSLQGEGRWVGLRNVFVRLSGCNLRCSFCDTKYAYEGGVERSVDEVIDEVSGYSCEMVCVTGGEPLLQQESFALVKALREKGYVVLVETNGSCDVSDFIGDDGVVISLDVKCPSSGMQDKMVFENIALLSAKDQMKMVIGSREDYDYAKEILKRFPPSAPVFLQPVWGCNSRDLAEWIVKDDLEVRLGLQLHKLLWGQKRGV